MKLSPSFVLALAAASSASASPLLRRQGSSSASNSLPTPSAAPGPVSPSGSASGSVSAPTASGSSLSAASSTSSAPASSSTASAGSTGSTGSSQTFNDTQILQYALTLEHLEAAFYNQSLNKLSTQDFEDAGYNASVRNQIYAIGRDEAQHVSFLTTALGNQSVPACTYNFSSVTDVASFLTTARVLEGVGVSAYLGAAQNITNKQYLEAAASILVVEGQHAVVLTAQTDDGGNAVPNAFATPLDFKQVYSLAAPFIESCPSNASLPITAFPSLTLTPGGNSSTNGSFTPGQQVVVSYNNTGSSNSSSGSKYLAIIQGVTGPQFVQIPGDNQSSQITLPSNVTGGQFYAVVTSSNSTVTDDNTIAGPAVGFANIPLPSAPEAQSTGSSSSSSSASTTASASSAGASSAGIAGPTGSASAPAGPSGSDSVISSQATPTGSASSGSASASGAMSLPSSLASAASARLPQPSSSA